MENWVIKFEIFDKKMKTTIRAYSKEEAIKKLKDKIVIYSCESKGDDDLEFLKEIFNLK